MIRSECLCPPPNSYVEIPAPTGDDISRWGLGRMHNYEGGILIYGISALEVPERFLVLSVMQSWNKKSETQKKGPQQNAIMLVP